MRILFPILLLLLCLCSDLAAQVPKDITLPVTASVGLNPASITLNWPNPGVAGQVIYRRTKGQPGNQWVQLYGDSLSTITSFTDNIGVVAGQSYEYFVARVTNLIAYGYAQVAVRTPVVDSRGKVLVFVDSTTADALGVELVRMKNDLRGDGWVVIPHKVGPFSTPVSVKNQIIQDYQADPQNVKAVFLIGEVPVPYCGEVAWDGHPDHDGAWPCDAFYGDLNGVWTDEFVANDSSGRQANRNMPGDGKYDQTFIPSLVELQVGRVDFRHINAPAFGEADAIGLIRRYLDKEHAWRTGAYTVQNKAIVDDNFGYFGGEAFAANGFRFAYPVVGESNIVEGDFFGLSQTDRYLMGYGCGGGNYNGAGGVGSSDMFATENVNIVFANLFGSYFGDWDYEFNPFMPSALASRGGILTCSWMGRPHFFMHSFASGETIGYGFKETQNAQFNAAYYVSVAESTGQATLLGNPTLRAHVVAPPTNVTLTEKCTSVGISWTASTDAVDGYHIYRSFSNDGPYIRITTSLVNGTSYEDLNPPSDTLHYQVRAMKSQITPGGGIYLNNSVGPISNVVHVQRTPPVVTIQGGAITCASPSVELVPVTNGVLVDWAWSGPNGALANEPTQLVTLSGNYSLTTTDAFGCSATASTFVELNTIPPVLNLSASGILTCAQLSSVISVSSATELDPGSFSWSNGANIQNIEVTTPGTYTVTVNGLQNGCSATAQYVLVQDIAPPVVDFPTSLTYTCSNPCVSISLPDQNSNEYYLNLERIDSTLVQYEICNTGLYSITTVSKSNGCQAENDLEVLADLLEPGATATANGVLTCTVTSIQLNGNAIEGGLDVSYRWDGPGITALTMNQQNPMVAFVGTYTVTVTNLGNGCTSTASYNVETDGSVPQVTATGGEVTCIQPGIDLTCTTNVAGSTFIWNGPNGFFSTDQNPNTTFPGTYTVAVTAPNGCSNSTTVVVADNTADPEFIIPTIPQLNCANPCVTVEFIPVTPGLVITPFVECSPGTVFTEITGPNGCTAFASFVVTKAPDLVAAIEPPFIDCDGSVTLTVLAQGGTPPYKYLWSNGTTFNSALYLLNSTPIAVTVTDDGGCSWTSDTLNIVAPPPVLVTSTIVNEHGVGASNGSIDITVNGGVPPYTYVWSNGAHTQDLPAVTGGTYTVTITDVNGCTTEYSFTVLTTVDTKEAMLFETLSLSPNPTQGISTLSIRLNEPMPFTVEVRDILGRMVQEKTVENETELTWSIDLKHQSPGIYQVSVTADQETFVRKLVRVE